MTVIENSTIMTTNINKELKNSSELMKTKDFNNDITITITSSNTNSGNNNTILYTHFTDYKNSKDDAFYTEEEEEEEDVNNENEEIVIIEENKINIENTCDEVEVIQVEETKEKKIHHHKKSTKREKKRRSSNPFKRMWEKIFKNGKNKTEKNKKDKLKDDNLNQKKEKVTENINHLKNTHQKKEKDSHHHQPHNGKLLKPGLYRKSFNTLKNSEKDSSTDDNTDNETANYNTVTSSVSFNLPSCLLNSNCVSSSSTSTVKFTPNQYQLMPSILNRSLFSPPSSNNNHLSSDVVSHHSNNESSSSQSSAASSSSSSYFNSPTPSYFNSLSNSNTLVPSSISPLSSIISNSHSHSNSNSASSSSNKNEPSHHSQDEDEDGEDGSSPSEEIIICENNNRPNRHHLQYTEGDEDEIKETMEPEDIYDDYDAISEADTEITLVDPVTNTEQVISKKKKKRKYKNWLKSRKGKEEEKQAKNKSLFGHKRRHSWQNDSFTKHIEDPRNCLTVTNIKDILKQKDEEEEDEKVNLHYEYCTTFDVFLDMKLAMELRKHIPHFYRDTCYHWYLEYSLSEHGSSLTTFYECQMYVNSPIIVVISDSYGSIFGAYLNQPFNPNHDGFTGNRECFLWKKTDEGELKIYRASSLNEYFILSDQDFIALGTDSNGVFGLFLDSMLLNGESSPCDTYLNEILSSKKHFECAALEIWSLQCE